ncbi:MAG: DUF4912 domain-containing protein [Candidatus Omnitrophica bacterium]|nr:DUF4912 domain-containing protein [Candidatus Omnitrophota bacterium]
MEKKDLAKMTKDELLELAKKLKIIGRYGYTKDQLISSIVKRYNALDKKRAKNKTSTGKKVPKVFMEKVKKVFSRRAEKKTKSVAPKGERITREREPRPYWEAPVPQPQAFSQERKEDLSKISVSPHEEEFIFPKGYGDNHIVLMVRDPWWLYSYWEINSKKLDEIRKKIGSEIFNHSKTVLRVYDVTDIIFNGNNAHSYFDITLHSDADNWYVDVGKPNRSWCVDIGLLTPDNKFFMLARSNVVKTPRFGMSDVTDEEWMSSEEDYWKLYGVAGGFGSGSSPLKVKKAFRQRFKEDISSGAPWSLFSFMEQAKKERKFWMIVNTELIVYGATEPDARVSVQGKPIKLRKDGTFTLRFALPDGMQHIPVEAVSADGIDKRKITPIVSRRTE